MSALAFQWDELNALQYIIMTLWNLLKSGGWVMFPLLVCSVFVWGVCAERLLALRNWRQKNREFFLSFSNLWLRQDFDGAQKICSQSTTELAELGQELLEVQARARIGRMDSEKVFSRLERKRLEQSAELKRNLWLLGTIGSAAPFIGLLGTVLGIIRSFQSMTETGAGGFTVVSAGISEALVATAAGIVVGVIAVFFYNFFQTRVGSLQFQLKLFTEEMFELWESAKAPSLGTGS